MKGRVERKFYCSVAAVIERQFVYSYCNW